ncbi:MAG: Ig-like domain-containing protein [Clostridiales bacterium]|nr:Ig-like domain-containing protein [Clostridiales bacterium]MBQ1575244.1 Ig-like domain-containing protein [Clostridiales bacterium]
MILSSAQESVVVNATVQLTASVVPSGLTVTWTSSDTDVATVSSAGLVTGKAAGSATITATVEDSAHETDSATCAVTVTSA